MPANLDLLELNSVDNIKDLFNLKNEPVYHQKKRGKKKKKNKKKKMRKDIAQVRERREGSSYLIEEHDFLWAVNLGPEA